MLNIADSPVIYRRNKHILMLVLACGQNGVVTPMYLFVKTFYYFFA